MVKRGRRHHSRRQRPRRKSHRNILPRKNKITFSQMSYFTRKHPIATGVILIIASIILFRLSFTNAFLSSTEFVMWSLLISAGLFIAGLLVLIGWWRNNISNLTTRHNVNWRNR